MVYGEWVIRENRSQNSFEFLADGVYEIFPLKKNLEGNKMENYP